MVRENGFGQPCQSSRQDWDADSLLYTGNIHPPDPWITMSWPLTVLFGTHPLPTSSDLLARAQTTASPPLPYPCHKPPSLDTTKSMTPDPVSDLGAQ